MSGERTESQGTALRTGGHAAILALVAEARSADDAEALAEALSLAHHCLLGPEHESLRLELAQELIGVASRTTRRGDLLMGLLWQTVDLFWSADPHAYRRLEELRGLLVRDDHLAIGFVNSAIDVMLRLRTHSSQASGSRSPTASCRQNVSE